MKGLLKDKRGVTRALRGLDPDVAGHVSREGWTKFVEAMARERVRHLRALGLAARRCYWGKGLDDRAAPSSQRASWSSSHSSQSSHSSLSSPRSKRLLSSACDIQRWP